MVDLTALANNMQRMITGQSSGKPISRADTAKIVLDLIRSIEEVREQTRLANPGVGTMSDKARLAAYDE